MSTAAASQATQNISYSDLYARWERGHWLATEIDFTQDRIDWQEKLTPEERKAALWFFALFFHGEDEVADDLSPYVEAAPLEEQTYFLTTQQVDESRHSVFFNRFMHEVVGLGDGSAGSGLDATKGYLTWGHKETFRNLANVAQQLRTDKSKYKFAEAITNYHIVVEGTLAQPGQHMIEAWLERADVLPGFLDGLRNIAIDEQRHIAFGMKTLADLYQEDPEGIGDVIIDAIRDAGSYLTAFAFPEEGKEMLAPLGLNLEELYADSMRALTSRMRGVGLTEAQRRRALTINPDISFEEQGRMVLQMLEAGYLGEGRLPKSTRPEDVTLLFEMMRNLIAGNPPKDGTVVQFDLTDVGPRYFLQSGGALEYHQTRHPAPTVSIKTTLADFIDIVGERANPVKLILQRRLWVAGDRSLLTGKHSVFGPPTKASARKVGLLERFGF
ncbi:MAG: ribonucleotide-diphosphate reductase subunit beta [Solirubrobacteraceae bacterium]|nr:ribonucleotide-diphosphate reductase subunit beta [Solirubrobacteraceae bacterium]